MQVLFTSFASSKPQVHADSKKLRIGASSALLDSSGATAAAATGHAPDSGHTCIYCQCMPQVNGATGCTVPRALLSRVITVRSLTASMHSASQCSLSTGRWSLRASLIARRAAADAATTVMPPVATSCSPASVLYSVYRVYPYMQQCVTKQRNVMMIAALRSSFATAEAIAESVRS
eukprot:18530-Heterococcus_DN1.PRE.3